MFKNCVDSVFTRFGGGTASMDVWAPPYFDRLLEWFPTKLKSYVGLARSGKRAAGKWSKSDFRLSLILGCFFNDITDTSLFVAILISLNINS